jgi:hypothetical protein
VAYSVWLTCVTADAMSVVAVFADKLVQQLEQEGYIKV